MTLIRVTERASPHVKEAIAGATISSFESDEVKSESGARANANLLARVKYQVNLCI